VDITWEPGGTVRGRAVLLHGVMSCAATWWRIGPALAAYGWQVRAMDLPGHGDGPRLGQAATLGALADGVAGRLGEPADLLAGHSLGAIVALSLLSRRPALARALVLEDPPSTAPAGNPALAKGIAHDAALVRTDREQLVRREAKANPRWLPRDVEHSADGIAAAEADALADGLHGALRWNLPGLMSAVSVPALVLAAPDTPGPFAVFGGSALQSTDRAWVRDTLPEGRFRVLDGGHCLHRDQPAAWVRAVLSFTAGVLR
jgi:pimeloyl-ACP methyl ester carboxylesterase